MIRLEFNSTLLDYYAELDAVRLHGVVDTAHLPSSGPASGPASGHASPTHTQSDRGGSPTGRAHGGGDLASNQCSSSATNLTESCETRVSTQLAELHLIDGLTAALDGPNNGYFDTLPVSEILCIMYVILLILIFMFLVMMKNIELVLKSTISIRNSITNK